MGPINRFDQIVYTDDDEGSPVLHCPLAGITQPSADYRSAHYPSEVFVVEYILSGKGYVEIDDQRFTLAPGSVCCIHKNASLISYADKEEPYEKIWFHFTGEMPEKLFDLFMLDDLYLSSCHAADLFFKMQDCLKQMGQRDPTELYARILNLLFEILSTASKERLFPRTAEKNVLAEQIRSYIDENIYADLSLEKIAAHFCYTKMHIIRVFKNKFSITPMQYLLDKKIGLAKSLLTETVMPVKEIASLLRYSSTQHFSASFKAAVGCTPNKYRQGKQS